MFEGLIEAWQASLAKYLMNSPETHRKVGEVWEDWDGSSPMEIELEGRENDILAAAKPVPPNNQITLAMGWFRGGPGGRRWVAAKQKSPLPPDFAGLFPPPGYQGEPVVDAHAELADDDWYREPVGVHAEMMIVRTWLRDLGGGLTLENIERLRGASVLVASQPACWCCAAFMDKYGIEYPADPGTKPKTGWRHPLNRRTVPNHDIPSQKLVTSKWIDAAAAF